MSDWPISALTDLLGIEHPIIQAPMAGASTPALAAAVSNAGGLGSIAGAMLSPDGFRAEAESARAATNRPINANFFVHREPGADPDKNARARALLKPYFDELGLGDMPEVAASNHPFGQEMLDAVLEMAPKVVSFHFGMPDPALLAPLKDAGMVILSSATTVREAQAVEEMGADAIIAQGWEAGGHRGLFLATPEEAQVGTMALVPQVVDAVSVPVIAAGGIADGRGIAAAFALGASGVQIGTAFLTTAEAGIAGVYKSTLLNARDDQTRLTRAFSGGPARGLSNRYVEEMAAHQESFPDFPLLNTVTGPLRKHSAKSGSPDFVAMWSGQAVRLNRESTAAALVESLIARTREVWDRSQAGR